MNQPHIDMPALMCPAAKIKEYSRRAKTGRFLASNSRCIFAGLARNIGPCVDAAAGRLEALGAHFSDYSVLVYENDSSDNTRDKLSKWALRNDKVTTIHEDVGDPANRSIRCLARTARMAKYRTIVQEAIRERFSDYEYVVLYDFDLGANFSIEGVLNSIGTPFLWHMMGSNSLRFSKGWKYYDVWALRWQGSYTPLWSKDVTPMRWWVGDDPFAVSSVFGGLGIYKTEAFLSATYDGTDCEHVPFHRDMARKGFGKIYLNPSQVVLYN